MKHRKGNGFVLFSIFAILGPMLILSFYFINASAPFLDLASEYENTRGDPYKISQDKNWLSNESSANYTAACNQTANNQSLYPETNSLCQWESVVYDRPGARNFPLDFEYNYTDTEGNGNFTIRTLSFVFSNPTTFVDVQSEWNDKESYSQNVDIQNGIATFSPESPGLVAPGEEAFIGLDGAALNLDSIEAFKVTINDATNAGPSFRLYLKDSDGNIIFQDSQPLESGSQEIIYPIPESGLSNTAFVELNHEAEDNTVQVEKVEYTSDSDYIIIEHFTGKLKDGVNKVRVSEKFDNSDVDAVDVLLGLSENAGTSNERPKMNWYNFTLANSFTQETLGVQDSTKKIIIYFLWAFGIFNFVIGIYKLMKELG